MLTILKELDGVTRGHHHTVERIVRGERIE